MEPEPLIAFAVPPPEAPVLEIRVNFGVFAGREATAAELDELAHALLSEIECVSVVSEDRHEVGDVSEAVVHQVRIEVPWEALPASAEPIDELGERLAAEAERWARACIAERHAEVSEL